MLCMVVMGHLLFEDPTPAQYFQICWLFEVFHVLLFNLTDLVAGPVLSCAEHKGRPRLQC